MIISIPYMPQSYHRSGDDLEERQRENRQSGERNEPESRIKKERHCPAEFIRHDRIHNYKYKY